VSRAGDSFGTVVTGLETGVKSRRQFWNSVNRTGNGCTKQDTVLEQWLDWKRLYKAGYSFGTVVTGLGTGAVFENSCYITLRTGNIDKI
jgi:hypothetical protein